MQYDIYTLVTLVPIDSSKASRGPFKCGAFHAAPETFYGYAEINETSEPMVEDMRGVPYAAIGELVVVQV